MEANNLGQMSCTRVKGVKKKTIATIGRWMPIHNGHKKFLADFATDVKFYDALKISEKHLAFEHNDMLKKTINMLEAYPKLHK